MATIKLSRKLVYDWMLVAFPGKLPLSHSRMPFLVPGLDIFERLVAEVGVVKFRIVSAAGPECAMRALFDDLSVADHNDAVGGLDR